MGCEAYTTFSKISDIGDTELINTIEQNLKAFLDYAYLSIGGWQDVTIPTSGAYGGTFDNLRLVDDPSYDLGQVWASARKDWVYESGSAYTGYAPIQISGVYVGGTLYGTGDATYGHHYNYPEGRMVFDTAIPTQSVVQAEYSYRNVQIYIADKADWFDQIQYNSYRVDDQTYSQYGSGNFSILSVNNVQLPAIVLEVVPRRSFTPYQMGDISQFVYQDAVFNVLAPTRYWRNKLTDHMSLLIDQNIKIFDSDEISNSGIYPLNYQGMLITNSGNSYPDLVDNYQKERMLCKFTKVAVTEMGIPTDGLYMSTIRVTLELIL